MFIEERLQEALDENPTKFAQELKQVFNENGDTSAGIKRLDAICQTLQAKNSTILKKNFFRIWYYDLIKCANKELAEKIFRQMKWDIPIQ